MLAGQVGMVIGAGFGAMTGSIYDFLKKWSIFSGENK